MPTCPRCALLAVVLAFLAFSGCDSNNPGRDLALIDGVYSLEALTFDPVTQGLPTADLGARLDLAGTSLEIFGADDQALLRIRYPDAPTRRVDLSVTAARGRATFTGVTQEDRDDLADLFLPAEFVLTYEGESPRVLANTFERTGVDLQAFDPTLYQDQRSNRGTLTVRFRRP
ncbi:hypothetical protein [Rubrivirga sp. IMCC43871]|uniref:hypothetical protein n=1 Tax=Rubrivirga sp. IMCC43871 TaxID=3391575 RepID=UPI00398FDFD1